ncbi:MAG TPA: DUF3108 domain-containing protein [Acetobacteraceae bacterium]|nr:DUF3108 domain-containing protein [Acetobacteraceae bacterium]
MRHAYVVLLAMLPCTAPAAEAPTVNLHYQAFAHGLAVVAMDVSLTLAPGGYSLTLSYHTTGLAGFLYPGREIESVSGTWNGDLASPRRYTAEGLWRGRHRRVDIVYREGRPEIVSIQPPDTEERDPVPPALRLGTEDSLSALAQLVRHVDDTGNCATAARTYDGRRLSEISASTAGVETLAPAARSMFAGTALRCDFSGRMLAGFRHDQDRRTAGRPHRGSAWFATVGATPALPVRMRFETRWFGDVTMLLTAVTFSTPQLAQATATPR